MRPHPAVYRGKPSREYLRTLCMMTAQEGWRTVQRGRRHTILQREHCLVRLQFNGVLEAIESIPGT